MQEKLDYFLVNERIVLIMNDKNLNKNSFAKLIGMSQPTIKQVENKENLPSLKFLLEILKAFPDISAEWLLTGKGAMLRTESNVESSREDRLIAIIESQQRTIEELSKKL
jgi:transcriptional regulator with XRE-family HTH domain